ncbi:hypothetical protein H696_06059 [Fonticula alba]|uniref:Uncharacterized protein n=1 Tax=Fonticula alba TaxID=691883 RepID=A0A058Z0A2_FONAL|nr:hypothetical protein H696_06059 [Fonticula alba]KCV67541.1 hypothetical protein H696_06059 [Fonticula alba]|eukprot:XP_009498102.1 hypothetical protein H696_06059 [Fonticula alba]
MASVPAHRGESLVQDIQAGRAPLPRGFDSARDFWVFLRLAGLSHPSLPANHVARLLGLDRASTEVLLSRYAHDFGIPAPRSLVLEQIGQEHVDDLLGLFRRDPPVVGQTLARLTGLTPGAADDLLKRHLAPDEYRQLPGLEMAVSLARLRELLTVAPTLPLEQMALLLSASWQAVSRAIGQSLPQYQKLLPRHIGEQQIARLQEILARPGEPPSPEAIMQYAKISSTQLQHVGPHVDPGFVIRARGPLSEHA